MAEWMERLQAALAGRYTIERELGRGGMATVYLARDLRHDRRVAVKVLMPRLAAALGSDRFLREIATAARLTHPHILPLYDSGDADGVLYYVMPWVSGESLRDRITGVGALPVAEALGIARGAASALAYAHSQGIVHRDIKPENILLEEGEAVIADFGIARALDVSVDDRLSLPGLAVGTPRYMSPEQSAGLEVDARTDIYSLGCVLHEMLAGEPPFDGPTPQVIQARHRSEPPRRVRAVRPTVSARLQSVLDSMLEKIPADRIQTAAELARVLEDLAAESHGAPIAPGARRLTRRTGLAAAGLVLVAALGLWGLLGGQTPLSPDRVVVYPLTEPAGRSPEARGESLALLLGHALEHTDPLKWIDGWGLLTQAQRADARHVSVEDEHALSRRAGARYFVDGAIVRSDDSTTVILRLYDVQGDSLVTQTSASAALDTLSLARVGLGAVTRLLPALLAPGRPLDASLVERLLARHPGAVAHWLQGDREYRRNRFVPALDHYRRAVAGDSGLVQAALSGAQAASWLNQDDEASGLVAVALAGAADLPPRYRAFAEGLAAYLRGSADTATTRYQAALAGDSSWTEAWTALGEAYFHLLPGMGSPDSLAGAAFTRAARLDSAFAPALVHLTELTIRRGDLPRGAQLVAQLRRFDTDTSMVAPLALMLECVERGAGATRWVRELARDPGGVLDAARALSAGAAHAACAEQGFRVVLEHEASPPNTRWGALLGLQGLLLAQGREAEVRTLLDASVATLPAAVGLFLVDAVAGAAFEDRAEAVSASLDGDPATFRAGRLWYLGEWAARRRDSLRLGELERAAQALAARTGTQGDRLVADALAAHLQLHRGDSAGALARFRLLASVARTDSLAWDPWHALVPERMQLAELLLASGDAEQAARVLEVFDGQQTVMFLPYLPRALALRVRAAEALGRPREGAQLRERIAALVRAPVAATRAVRQP